MIKCKADHGKAELEMHGPAGKLMEDLCGIVEAVTSTILADIVDCDPDNEKEQTANFRTIANLALIKAVSNAIERVEAKDDD